MIYSGLGFVTFVIWFGTWLLFVESEMIFDPVNQRTLMYVNLFGVNAILNFMVGSFLDKKRIEALTHPEIAEKNIIKWELPSSLFFIKVKWWSLVFVGMIIYFLMYGYVPVMTNRI